MKKFVFWGMFLGISLFCCDKHPDLTEFSPATNQTQRIENTIRLKGLSCRTEDPKQSFPSSQSDGNIIGTAVQQVVNVMNHYGYTLRRSQSSENLRQLFDDLTREAQANND